MDEFVRRKGLWIGLALLGAVSMCLVLCLAAALVGLGARQTVAYAPVPYVAAPDGEQEQAPPVYQAPMVSRHSGGRGLLGIVGSGLRLLFMGLLLLVGLRLFGRLLWGPRRCWAPYWGARHHWGPYHGGQPPSPQAGSEGEAGWGPPPWVHGPWRHPHHHWGPPTSDEGEADWGPPPWAHGPWRHWSHHWGPPPSGDPGAKKAGEAEKPATGDAEYTGPQE